MESKYVYNTLEKLNNAQFRRDLSCNVDTIDITQVTTSPSTRKGNLEPVFLHSKDSRQYIRELRQLHGYSISLKHKINVRK